MPKKTKTAKALDAKHFGTEPDLRGDVERIDILNAYNWYNYNCDADQAKSWIIEYLKEFYKTEKELIKNANRIDVNHCRTSGWNCRILLLGGNLPQELRERNEARIRSLAASAKSDSGSSTSSEEEGGSKEVSREEVNANSHGTARIHHVANDSISSNMANGIDATERSGLGTGSKDGANPSSTIKGRRSKAGSTTEGNRTKNGRDERYSGIIKERIGVNGGEAERSDSDSSSYSGAEAATFDSEEVQENSLRHSTKSTVISIQERIANRANDLIADLEVLLDAYYQDGNQFKMSDWIIKNNVKPQVAQRIAAYYKPLYSEAFDALNGKDEQLKEGYSHYKKTQLKAYVEFLRSIVSCAETTATTVKARKPRKKKEKPVSVIVSKLKFKEKDDEYKITSVDPKQIVGCNQLWVFNTKYRTLAVYNAMGPAGLNVKGSTLTGFDEKTSIVKKLRKPPEQLNKLMDGGKIVLRKYMDEIKCKSKEANGRINNETVLLRIIK